MFLIDLFNKLFKRKHKPQPKLSILIPFKTDNMERKRTFKWLLEYWKNELPDAEIIIGLSHSRPFSKTEALNNAAEKSTGKVIAILDADAYMSGKVLDRVADRIIEEVAEGERLWYVPYRRLYRLTKAVTKRILASDPKNPYRPPDPPPYEFIDGNSHSIKYGHRYGAMIMVFPREALQVLGCFDERFRGWGGEDVALLRALDTLYVKHKTVNTAIFHLWHPYIGNSYKSRVWENQKNARLNENLAYEYHKATRRPSRMRELVDEGCKFKSRRRGYRRRHLKVR